MMQYETEIAATFKKEFKRLYKRYPSLRQDVENLRNEVVAQPSMGTDLGKGLRKIRMRIASKGKGKSGGARVITLLITHSDTESEIGLHYIYDKSERESLTDAELRAIIVQNGL